jgi:hypothetical protein
MTRVFRPIYIVTILLSALSGCSTVPTGVGSGAASTGYSVATEIEGVTTLDISWRGGTISVVAESATTAILASGTATVRAATDESAATALEDVNVRFDTTDAGSGRVRLVFDAPENGAAIYSATAFVVVPTGVDLNIESESGNVQVVGADGAVGIAVVSGNISVFNQTGAVSATTENGNIEVNGAIGAVSADTLNGNIAVNTNPLENGSVTATTLRGGVTIVVPASVGASLRLEATVGTVFADLNAFTLSEPSFDPNRVTAVLNDGGGSIVGSTGNGFVTFSGFGG